MAPKMPVPKCRIEITLPLISGLTKKKKNLQYFQDKETSFLNIV